MHKTRLAAIAALGAWGTGLCLWLWERTGDVLGDFGHELYIAWQLSQGRIFQRDIVYQYGPLSPWINAVWMRLFGPDLRVILLANAAVLIAVTVLLNRLVRQASSDVAAFVATAFFLAVFALSSPARDTNYNFLNPYAHGVTHGFLLCLGMAYCLIRFHESGRIRWAAGAAFLTGASWLTKPEMSLACAITFAAGLAGSIWPRRQRAGTPLIIAVTAALLAAPLAAWFALLPSMPASAALEALAGGWQYVTPHHIADSPMHVSGLGLDDVGNSLRMIALSAMIDITIIALLIALSMFGKRRIASVMAAAMFALVAYTGRTFPNYWLDADRALVLLPLIAAPICAWRLFRTPPGHPERRRPWAQWLIAVLSLALLPKMFLNVRTYHYGFVLAAPCAMLAVAALIDWLPTAIERRGGAASVARLGAIGLLAGFAFNRIILTDRVLSERTLRIPLAMGGTLHARPIDTPAADAIAWLRQSPPATTAAIYPDAAGIAFASAKSSALRYNVLNPMTLSMWGEQNAVQSAKRHPPDMILVVRTDAGELGAHFFGEDYGASFMDWIRTDYDLAGTVGDTNALRSIQVWKKRK